MKNKNQTRYIACNLCEAICGHDKDGVNLRIAKDHAGVNTNILTDEYFLDSVSGNTAFNGVPVSLIKATKQESI